MTSLPGNGDMRVGAAIFGISEYVDVTLNADDNKLHFASNDALSFEKYVRAAWPISVNHAVQCWTDRNATLAQWSSSIAHIATTKPELFIVYLAGHALRSDNSNVAFCLTDTRDEDSAITSKIIDQTFNVVDAKISILFLDCCYAEAIVNQTAFFCKLARSRARLFLCSARSNQPAWEDVSIKHGLFSRAVIRGLANNSPLANRDAHVDIDHLFAFVSDEVSKNAFARKDRARQEPVRGGLSTGSLRLPTASNISLGSQISTYDAVAAGFRRWLVRLFLFLIASFVISDLTFQHLAVDTHGKIVARSGLPLFNPIRRLLPGGITETGFNSSDLNRSETETTEDIAALDNGTLLAYRLWESYAWPAILATNLATEPRQRLSIFLNARLDHTAEKYNPNFHAPPFDEFMALFALKPNIDLKVTAKAFEYDMPEVHLDCTRDVANYLDLTTLTPATDRLNKELDWRLSLAADPEDHREKLQEALRIVAYRHLVLTREKERGVQNLKYQGVEEFRRLADWARTPRYRSFIPGMMHSGSWCSIAEAFIAVLSNDKNVSMAGERYLLTLVHTYDSASTGDALNYNAEIGLSLLSILAREITLEDSTVDSISGFLRRDKRGLDGLPDLVAWLAEIAPTTPLPADTLQFLVDTLLAPLQEHDFRQLTAFNILARNAAHLSYQIRKLVLEWERTNSDEYVNQDSFVDGISYLVPYLPSQELHYHVTSMANRTEPWRSVKPPETTWRGDMLISISGVAEWVSISRIAQQIKLPSTTSDGLLLFANANQDTEERRLALRGFAHQQEPIRTNDWEALRQKFALLSSDSISRDALSEAAGLYLCGRKTDEIDFDLLRAMWSKETVPILRIAFAKTIQSAKICTLTN